MNPYRAAAGIMLVVAGLLCLLILTSCGSTEYREARKAARLLSLP